MASKEFNVIAIIHPKQGKTDRVCYDAPLHFGVLERGLISAQVVELLKGVAQYVRANEPGELPSKLILPRHVDCMAAWGDIYW